MCEACKLREMHDATDWEATMILRMLLNKTHVRLTKGGVAIEIKLSESEMDWLCEWDSAIEDFEDSDPAEQDSPPEESEQLETDFGIRIER